ncbi:MAG: zinc metallopeptidase [Puniceicoccales bacterium]|jgi:hypothetical protein|nr:zinc metallopeptidase [Puniceicoccales bacterium]
MPLLDYLIGGSLCTSYAVDAVEFLSEPDAPSPGIVVTDPAKLERVYPNPLLQKILERKGVQLRGSPGFFFRMRVLFREIGLGLVTLVASPLSIVVGIWAHFKLNEIHYALADISNPKPQEGNKTVYEVMQNANSTLGQVAIRAGKPVRIIKGATNDLSACYYDPIEHVVSIPPCIGKTITRSGGNHCQTDPDRSYGPPAALAISAHEMGHAEQHKFLKFIHYGSVVITALVLCFCIIAHVFLVSPGLFICIATLAFVIRPIIQFFYERDASIRAIANLIANENITTRQEAIEAVETLQIAASTYLANTAINLLKSFWKLLKLYLQRHEDTAYKPS